MSKLLIVEHSGAIYGQAEKRINTGSFYILILGDIKQAIRGSRDDEYEHLRTCVVEANKQFDLSDREAHILLRILDILKVTNEEERLKLMMELTPDLLKPHEHRQAELDHKFRLTNKEEHSCDSLYYNAEKQCAECMKKTREDCMKICPAREESQEIAKEVNTSVAIS